MSPNFPPPFVGGSHVYIHNLVEHCPGRLHVFAARSAGAARETLDGRHRIIRSRLLVKSSGPGPSRMRLALMYASLVLWSLMVALRRRYDVVVVNPGLVGNSLLIPIFAALRLPVVGVAYAEELTIALKGTSLKNRFKRWLMRASYPKADGFIAVSDFTRCRLVEIGVPVQRIRVILPTLDQRKHRPDGLPSPAGCYILTAGRLVARKGFDLLIEAMTLLRTKVPEVKLYIVGGGPEHARLAQHVKQHNLDDIVYLLGEIGDEELAALYRGAALFVLANIALANGDCEGCPTVLIEASAHAKPVIAGIEGGTSSAVRDGVTGFLVDPRDVSALADRMKTILLDPDLARRLGEAGRQRVKEEHDPRKAGDRFLSFLRHVERRDAR